jgi:hypothetical protein
VSLIASSATAQSSAAQASRTVSSRSASVKQKPCDLAHPLLVGFLGDVFDRRFAVDSRQQQRRQEARRALVRARRAAPN